MSVATRAGHLLTWSAMGTTCRAWFVGPGAADAALTARSTVAQLEARWSRFRPGSDVSRLNAAGGSPVAVSSLTRAILSDAIAWWRATDGLFDPTVLHALVDAGYDRDRATGHGPITPGEPAPGCDGIRLDPESGTVRLPPGVGIDLGGDLRVWGRPPEGEGWPIAVEDLRDATTAALLGLTGGAVATSSTLRRRWDDGRLSAHHLIDPRTGRPAGGELVTVTVVAGRAGAAEVLAKSALVAGTVRAAHELLDRQAVAALLVPELGPPVEVGDFRALCWTPPGEVA